MHHGRERLSGGILKMVFFCCSCLLACPQPPYSLFVLFTVIFALVSCRCTNSWFQYCSCLLFVALLHAEVLRGMAHGLWSFSLYLGFWFGCEGTRISLFSYLKYQTGILILLLGVEGGFCILSWHLHVLVPVVYRRGTQIGGSLAQLSHNLKPLPIVWLSFIFLLQIGSSAPCLKNLHFFILLLPCIWTITPQSSLRQLKSLGLKITTLELCLASQLLWTRNLPSLLSTFTALETANTLALLTIWLESLCTKKPLGKSEFLQFLMAKGSPSQGYKSDIIYLRSLTQQELTLAGLNVILYLLDPGASNLSSWLSWALFAMAGWRNPDWKQNRFVLCLLDILLIVGLTCSSQKCPTEVLLRGCGGKRLLGSILSAALVCLLITLSQLGDRWARIRNYLKRWIPFLLFFQAFYVLIIIECVGAGELKMMWGIFLVSCLLCGP